jgi:hypothetical protein
MIKTGPRGPKAPNVLPTQAGLPPGSSALAASIRAAVASPLPQRQQAAFVANEVAARVAGTLPLERRVRRAVPINASPRLLPRKNPPVLAQQVNQAEAAIARAEVVATRGSAEVIASCDEIDQMDDLCVSEKMQRYADTALRLRSFINATPDPARGGIAGQAFSAATRRGHEGYKKLLERQQMTPACDQVEEMVAAIFATLEKIDGQAPPPGGRRKAYRDTFDRLNRLSEALNERDPLDGLESAQLIMQVRRQIQEQFAQLPAE